MSSDPQPEMPEGYLGPQERFNELGLSVLSHTDPVIVARDNHFEIKLKNRGPVKVTHQLQFCKDERDFSEYVFTQIKDGNITFLIHFPQPGWYKLQIYALPQSDPSKSLPNVYNYLLHCTKALNPAFPFPKQYVQWKEGCYLYEPLNLCESTRLTHVKWRVLVPHAKQVAVVVDEEWNHLENKGGPIFEGSFNLNQYRGKDKKVTLNASFGEDESKYATLLEYHIK